jgi:hypothetical protein
MSNPGINHWNALLDILIFLRSGDNRHNGILFTRHEKPTFRNIVSTNVDSDHINDIDTRRSTTGWGTMMNGGLISWGCQLQPTASGSGTAQSEIVAFHKAHCETLTFRYILEFLGFDQGGPSEICEDNQACIDFVIQPASNSRLKHLEAKYHEINDMIKLKLIFARKIKSSDNFADIFTKAEDVSTFLINQSKIMRNVKFQPYRMHST